MSWMQAFYLARTGRPGPVLIDVPKDVQQQLAVPDWDVPMAIAGYMGRLPPPPTQRDIDPILQALKEVRAHPPLQAPLPAPPP
jgi:acetolactate synthase-1/2/3 large subunit